MTLSEVLLKMVHEAQGPCNMEDMVAILRKDAGKKSSGFNNSFIQHRFR